MGSARLIVRSGSYLAAAATALLIDLEPAGAQRPVGPTVSATIAAHDAMKRAARELGARLWPDFRPDTIAMLISLDTAGAVLLSWRHPLPEGFEALSGVADAGWRADGRGGANTSGLLRGVRVALLTNRGVGTAALAGLAAHEAFHAHESAVARQGMRFGAGENALLTLSYPVFDVRNEALFALEAALLADALRASDRSERARVTGEFLAVRAVRQRALAEQLVEFEKAAELHEGVAEYIQQRVQAQVAGGRGLAGDPPGWALAMADRVDRLVDSNALSVRARFYATGTALMRLLDAHAGEDHKQRMLREDAYPQEALAMLLTVNPSASALSDSVTYLRAAEQRVARLRALRRAQVDSALSGSGILVEISAERSGGSLNLCGFDPLNAQQAGRDSVLHARYLSVCREGEYTAEWNTAVAQFGNARVAGLIGPEGEVQLSVDGREHALRPGERLSDAHDVRITSVAFTLQATRADVERIGNTLRVTPISPPRLHPASQ